MPKKMGPANKKMIHKKTAEQKLGFAGKAAELGKSATNPSASKRKTESPISRRVRMKMSDQYERMQSGKKRPTKKSIGANRPNKVSTVKAQKGSKSKAASYNSKKIRELEMKLTDPNLTPAQESNIRRQISNLKG